MCVCALWEQDYTHSGSYYVNIIARPTRWFAAPAFASTMCLESINFTLTSAGFLFPHELN